MTKSEFGRGFYIFRADKGYRFIENGVNRGTIIIADKLSKNVMEVEDKLYEINFNKNSK